MSAPPTGRTARGRARPAPCARWSRGLLALLVVLGCGEAPEDARNAAPEDSVTLVFTRDEAPVEVRRAVAAGPADLRTALSLLVRGPSEEEQAADVRSWFSAETAEVVASVAVDTAGHAVVDFQDLRSFIPNASSSFGSAMLLEELNGTVFQFPEIQTVEYRMDGSCDLFWEWLQYDCQIVGRPGG